jgi:hypothetical protein
MNTKLMVCLFGVALLGTGLKAAAQGTAFTYQGRLTENDAPYTGNAEFQATLWDALNGGSQIAGNSPAQVFIGVTNGLFVLPLNFGASFPGADRWLQLEVRTNIGSFTTLTPRQQLTATPYALTASHLSGTLPAAQLIGPIASANLAGTYSSALTLNNSANSFSGSGAGLNALNASRLTSGTVPAAALGNAWTISGNAGTTPGTHSLGTTDNQPLELKVNDERALRLEPTAGAPNIIGGAAENQITPNSAGGGVLSGAGHRIFNASDYSVISGGFNNYVGIFSTGAFIGGGQANRILNSSSNSVIAGGESHQISGAHSSIGGGLGQTNRASFAFIGGGKWNRINFDSDYSFIAGGIFNAIEDFARTATISGGNGNTIHFEGGGSTIGGGGANSILSWADHATIGGGLANSIRPNAEYATIPGGRLNSATNYAFAAGRRAKANHTGSFVWADSTDADFASQRDDQFRVRAEGGARFDFNAGEWVDLRYQSNILTSARIIHTSSGGYLSLGGTWVNSSDRERKTHFTPVDPQAVLAKVAALPLSEWSYRNEGNTLRHVGPMAQDFHAAFRLGGDNRSIATVDADGVALAAIQGLNQKLEEKNAEIESLTTRLHALEQVVRGLAQREHRAVQDSVSP